jgi:predicted RNA-binding Zn ribbon-like protein
MNSGAVPLIDPTDWAFHFETGRPCLDFVATVGDRAHLAFDRWRTAGDLARWCVEAGLLTKPPSFRAKQLKQAQMLRESIHQSVGAIRAGKRAKPRDLAVLNLCAARPPLAPQLAANGRTVTWRYVDPLEGVLATIARDAIELMSGPDLERVRQCGAPSCSVLFVDTSRPGKRRWCSMNRCGNRMKKAAFRQRLRQKT